MPSSQQRSWRLWTLQGFLQITGASECTHMEPNVPRTKASLSRLMMRLGVLTWLTCHHHADNTSANSDACHGRHMTLAEWNDVSQA